MELKLGLDAGDVSSSARTALSWASFSTKARPTVPRSRLASSTRVWSAPAPWTSGARAHQLAEPSPPDRVEGCEKQPLVLDDRTIERFVRAGWFPKAHYLGDLRR